VSIIADRRADALAERRPEARAIHTIRPMRTIAASAIHSHSSDELDPLSAAVEAAAGGGAAAVSGSWLAGGASAVGAGGPAVGRLMLAVRLGDRLEIALLTAPLTGPLPPQPVAMDPMIIAVAATARLFLSRVIASSYRPAHATRRRPVWTAAAWIRPTACCPPGRGVFTRYGWAGSARLARLDQESLGMRNE
jgi:hypothetical protein